MSAETLRKAATRLRKDQAIEENLGHIDAREYATWLAVAAWLDTIATGWDERAARFARGSRWASMGPWSPPTEHPALTVATAYLGDA